MGFARTATALPMTRRGAVVARQAHNLEVSGSNPRAATKRPRPKAGVFLLPNTDLELDRARVNQEPSPQKTRGTESSFRCQSRRRSELAIVAFWTSDLG